MIISVTGLLVVTAARVKPNICALRVSRRFSSRETFNGLIIVIKQTRVVRSTFGTFSSPASNNNNQRTHTFVITFQNQSYKCLKIPSSSEQDRFVYRIV